MLIELKIKRLLILFVTLIFTFNIYLNAQDTILMKDGRQLNLSVIKRTNNKIMFKCDSSSTSVESIKLSKIKSIHYNNGEVDLLRYQNPRSIHPLGLYVGTGIISDDKLINGTIDYFLTPKLSVEISLGKEISMMENGIYYSYYSIGGKYWFAKEYSKNGFSPFAGLQYFRVYESKMRFNYLEIPIGVSYITKIGFQTSLHLSYLYDMDYGFMYNYDYTFLFAGLSVGWRF